MGDRFESRIEFSGRSDTSIPVPADGQARIVSSAGTTTSHGLRGHSSSINPEPRPVERKLCVGNIVCVGKVICSNRFNREKKRKAKGQTTENY